MKLTKYTLSSLLVVFIICGFTNERAIRDLKEWDEDTKINWEDYKGRISDTSKIASSSCGIYCIPQVIGDSAEVTLVAYLDRNKSWVSKKHSDSLLLQHEQGHFDLTEAYTRKLRKKLSGIRPERENLSAEVQKFYSWAWDDLQKQQQAYDKATDHGAVSFAQRTWDKHIKDLMKLYADFSSPIVKFGVVN